MPYNYNIIIEYVGEAKYIFDLEIELKRINKQYRYKPRINFNGKYECFSDFFYLKKVWEEYQQTTK